jgi:hypothetical protein
MACAFCSWAVLLDEQEEKTGYFIKTIAIVMALSER